MASSLGFANMNFSPYNTILRMHDDFRKEKGGCEVRIGRGRKGRDKIVKVGQMSVVGINI